MNSELMLFEKSERVVVSSRVIAERFEKSHPSVLKAIFGETRNGEHVDGLIDGIRSRGFPLDLYFVNTFYTDTYGRRQPETLCTRDGFSLLAMGFTGQKALEWKLKYIQAFNLMETALRERQSSEWLITRKNGKLMRRSETDALAQLAKYAEAQGSKNMRKNVYIIYTKLVNTLVGISAGQRDSVPFKTLSTIMFLEDMILHTVAEEMEHGTYYKEIYKICKHNGEQIMRFAYLPAA